LRGENIFATSFEVWQRVGGVDYRCRHPGCERVFDTKTGRATHERKIHGEHYVERETAFVCPHCRTPKYFDTGLGLHAHLEEYHGMPSMTLDWIGKRTFENLVYIYNDELYKIESDRVRSNTNHIYHTLFSTLFHR